MPIAISTNNLLELKIKQSIWTLVLIMKKELCGLEMRWPFGVDRTTLLLSMAKSFPLLKRKETMVMIESLILLQTLSSLKALLSNSILTSDWYQWNSLVFPQATAVAAKAILTMIFLMKFPPSQFPAPKATPPQSSMLTPKMLQTMKIPFNSTPTVPRARQHQNTRLNITYSQTFPNNGRQTRALIMECIHLMRVLLDP